MKDRLKKGFWNVLMAIAIIVLASMIISKAVTGWSSVFSYRMFYIMSESMEPVIAENSLAIGKVLSDSEMLQVGNIYAYKRDGILGQEIVIHILSIIPEFSEDAYIVINNNTPYFTSEEKECKCAFEIYSDLDELGRCGVAYANICREIMPTEERGAIGQIKPSGWQLVKYDIVEGKYLYNRCHLIGYQLAGENANEKNLITGTRFLNVSGMLSFENMVYDYVKETENHVLYRVTPLYNENNLVATGVLIEAYSVEDDGDGICFNVFIYNSQPGIEIDYATGNSWLVEDGTDFVDRNTTFSTEDTIDKPELFTEQYLNW